MDDITKETKKNAYLYCKFRDEQLALYDEYAKRHGMLMKTLLVVNVLYYDDFYDKGGVTQTEICHRTFQSKQTVNLIIRNLLNEAYVTVEERKENKREKLVRITEAGKTYCEKVSVTLHGQKIRQCLCLHRRSKNSLLISHEHLQKI